MTEKKAELVAPASLLSDIDCRSLSESYYNNIYVNSNELNNTISVLSDKKKDSLLVAQAYDLIGRYTTASRIRSCGSFIEIAINESDYEDVKVSNANFCKNRFCPQCAVRRSMKIFGQLSKIFDVISSEYEFLFLTLTVRNCNRDKLNETLDLLFNGFRCLTHGSAGKQFQQIAKGTFRTLEVTYNKRSDTFHPHLHVLVAVEKQYFSSRYYLNQKQFTDIWQRCCRLDYVPMVNVQKVKNRISGLKEVSKYSIKPSDLLADRNPLSVAYLLDDLLVMEKRHLVSMTGVFRKIHRQLNLVDPELADLTDEDEINPVINYIIVQYHWDVGLKYYSRFVR